MQILELNVMPARRYVSQDGFQVYADHGTGVMDWSHAVSGRRLPFWEDASPAANHLEGAQGVSPHLDAVRWPGHALTLHLVHEHLYPTSPVTWHSRPLVFGRFRYAVVAEDAAGNARTEDALIRTFVINSEPTGPTDLRPAAFSFDTGRHTFGFTGSDQLVG